MSREHKVRVFENMVVGENLDLKEKKNRNIRKTA
jgi:hypothetical protein